LWQARRQTQLAGGAEQAFVARPQGGPRGQADGREAVSIDVTDAPSEQGLPVDKMPNFSASFLRVDANSIERFPRCGIMRGEPL
jgi:hypothetical protein